MSSAGDLVREARRRHDLDQRSLARRAGTSQAQISRIERGEISPSVETLTRLLRVMGEGLQLEAVPLVVSNEPSRELREDFGLTPAERVVQAAEHSYAATRIAAARDRH